MEAKNALINTHLSRLSAAQERMWFLDRLDPQSARYNMSLSIDFEGELDIPLLEKTLNHIISYHPMMRTNFVVREGIVYQYVNNETMFIFRKRIEKSLGLDELVKCATAFVSQPFDLQSDLLIRAYLLKERENFFTLVISMHHLIADGWSLGILTKEIQTIYTLLKQNQPITLELANTTYFDYVKDEISSETVMMSEALKFWKKKLYSYPSSIKLPEVVNNGNTDFMASGKCYEQLSLELSEKIGNMAAKHKVTPYMLLLSCFFLLITIYTKREDILIGTPLANRDRKRFENIFGLFVNTIVLRMKVDKCNTFLEMLLRLKEEVLQASQYSYVPFNKVIEAIKPQRQDDENDIFNIIFVMQNTPLGVMKLPGVKASYTDIHNLTAKFDITFSVIKPDKNYCLSIEYKKKYSDSFIKDFLQSYITLLHEVLEKPELTLNDYSLVSGNELPTYIKKYTENVRIDSVKCTLIDKFRNVVEQHAGNIAIVHNDFSMTYFELHKLSDRIANHINVYTKFATRKIIAILLKPGVNLVSTILGILKTGNAYLPIDPNYPAERISYIIKHSKINYIVSDTVLKNQYKESFSKQICFINLDDLANVDDIEGATPPGTKPNDIAYVIYTSGSTGWPKGVMVTNTNVLRLFSVTKEFFKYCADDSWLMFHSAAFDFSVWEMWGALLHGSKLVVTAEEERLQFARILELLEKHKVSFLNLTPTAYKQLVDEPLLSSYKNRLSLRYVIFGGEKLYYGDLRRWHDMFKDRIKLINMYGITEITVHATLKEINLREYPSTSSIIGKPLPDMYFYLLDDKQRPVKTGCVGEIYIGGAGVTKGYLYNDELTSKRFIADPFREKNILYRSGDFGFSHENGDIEYSKRCDNQIKIRGYRVELDEINLHLKDDPLISNAVVRLVNDNDEEQLVAYVCINHDEFRQKFLPDFAHHYLQKWTSIFNQNYEKDNPHKTFNINGWVSSYDNTPYSNEDMEEWVSETVERIKLLKPKRILEIGCGTGLLLFRLAESSERYVGIDASKAAIDSIQSYLKNNSEYKHVELQQCSADMYQLDKEEFDCIILNSVVQYFPDIHYLDALLHRLTNGLSKHGFIFIGDVRPLNLCNEFYLDLELSQIKHSTTIGTLRSNIQRRKNLESELLIDYRYFYNFVVNQHEIKNILIVNKNGELNNEMNKYRFDVFLVKEGRGREKTQQMNVMQEEVFDYQRLVRNLVQSKVICLIGRRNDHCAGICEAYENINYESNNALSNQVLKNSIAGNPINVYLSRIQHEYSAMVFRVPCIENKMLVDVFIIPKEKLTDFICSSVVPIDFISCENNSYFSNNPLYSQYQQELVEHIKINLSKSLPSYMIPQRYVILDKLPITVNGKLDYLALPRLTYHNSYTSAYEKPVSETEFAIATMMQELLNITPIGRHDDFFKLGGHSILAARLIMYLSTSLNYQIELNMLMKNSTPASLANIIESNKEVTSSYFMHHKDLMLTSRLIRPKKPASFKKPKNILLTGATGFLGTFLLAELLKSNEQHIYCLVKDNDLNSAYFRLINSLKSHQLWREVYHERIHVILGDLEKEELDISPTMFDFLKSHIDAILHNGAIVNFSAPYDKLRKANVLSTLTLLNLAVTEKIKKFHFISSLYVFKSNHRLLNPISESEVPDYFDEHKLAYLQTKVVSEYLVNFSRQHYLPANIYRIGRISGDTQFGACHEKDFFWRFIRLCLNIGVFPKVDLPINIIAVDDVSRVVVSAVCNNEDNLNYHISNPHSISFTELLLFIRQRGYDFKLLDPLEWTDFIKNCKHLTEEDLALVPLIVDSDSTSNELSFSNVNFNKTVNDTKFHVQKINNELLDKYFSYFENKKFFRADKQFVTESY